MVKCAESHVDPNCGFHRGLVEHTRICRGLDIYVTKCVTVGNRKITIHQNVVA